METRALLAFIISLIILVGYQALFAPPPQRPVEQEQRVGQDQRVGQEPRVEPAQPTDPAAPAAQTPPDPAAPRLARPSDIEEELVEVDTELFHAVFTSFGGRLKSFELKEYALTNEPNSPPLDMVASDSLLPLGLYWRGSDGAVAADVNVVYDVSVDKARVRGATEATVTFSGHAASGRGLTKRIRMRGDSYVLGYEAAIADGHDLAIGVAWSRNVTESQGRYGGTDGPVVLVDDELEYEASAALDEPLLYQGSVAWAGYADHYFLAAYYPDEARVLRFVAAAAPGGVAESQLWDESAGESVAYNLFVGPKRLHLLGELGHGLQEAVDLGWFTVVARPLLELLFALHKLTGNYGWAILLLTVGIRIVFYPINKRQVVAMKAMQRIQPELKKLQEKYKDDRERLNKEMIETYRRHKVNPMAGCLPMVLQIPVFIGLYNALMQAIELRHAPFIAWIDDLSQPDRLGVLKIPFVSPPGIPVMTLLMGVSMLLQQRMTPSMGDPMQQRMMMLMPIFFTVLFVNFPAGLVLYWLANNVMMIVQQYLTNRAKA